MPLKNTARRENEDWQTEISYKNQNCKFQHLKNLQEIISSSKKHKNLRVNRKSDFPIS